MADSFYPDDEAVAGSGGAVKSPRTMYLEAMAAHTSTNRRELPRISMDDPHYSSTLAMLKKTRVEVEEFTRDLGAINAVADLPVSADVRRTVARMFADPRNAEAISESEWRKREHQYQIDKEQFGERVSEHLRREREVVQRELQHLSK